jgi:hypothetical protein
MDEGPESMHRRKEDLWIYQALKAISPVAIAFVAAETVSIAAVSLRRVLTTVMGSFS